MLYGLTEDDLEVLREVIKDKRDQRRNLSQRPPTRQFAHETYSPEVYVASTPPLGIPGTAVDPVSNATVVGNALCPVYNVQTVTISQGANPSFQLCQVGALSQIVFNLSTAPIQGGIPVLVIKDKAGQYYCTSYGVTCTGLGTVDLTKVPGYDATIEQFLYHAASTGTDANGNPIPMCIKWVSVAAC